MTGLLKLTEHVPAGDTLLERLKRARARRDIARLVRALRKWHRELQPIAAAYSVPLAEGLRKMNPRPEENARVHGVIFSPLVVNRYGKIYEAQRRMLVTTATALYRIAPHLAAVPAKDKGGNREIPEDDIIAEIHRLRVTGKLIIEDAIRRVIPEGLTEVENERMIGRLRKKYRKHRKEGRIDRNNLTGYCSQGRITSLGLFTVHQRSIGKGEPHAISNMAPSRGPLDRIGFHREALTRK